MNIDVFEKIMYIISQCNYDKINLKVIKDKYKLSELLEKVDNSNFNMDIKHRVNNPNVLFQNICLYEFINKIKIIGYDQINSFDSCKKIIMIDKNNKAYIEMKYKSVNFSLHDNLINSQVDEKFFDKFEKNVIVDYFTFYFDGQWYFDLQVEKDCNGNLLSEQLKFNNYLIEEYQSNSSDFYANNSQLEILYKDEVPIYANVNINGLSSDSIVFAKLCVDTINNKLTTICSSLLYMLPLKYNRDNKSKLKKMYYLKKHIM